MVIFIIPSRMAPDGRSIEIKIADPFGTIAKALDGLEALAGLARDNGLMPIVRFKPDGELLDELKEKLIEELQKRGIEKRKEAAVLSALANWEWLRVSSEPGEAAFIPEG